MKISDAFIDADPDTWPVREDYFEAADVVHALSVTNDHAERGVALIQEFNQHLTKDEEQLQFLLQVVSDHRKRFPDCLKRTLVGTGY